MIPKDLVLRVPYVEYSQDTNGQYKSEYWGRYIVDQHDVLHYCTTDGKCLQSMFVIQDGPHRIFSASQLLGEDSFKQNIKDLCELRKSFKVEEIIRLKEKNII